MLDMNFDNVDMVAASLDLRKVTRTGMFACAARPISERPKFLVPISLGRIPFSSVCPLKLEKVGG